MLSYLTTIQKFFEFIIAENQEPDSKLPAIPETIILSMKRTVTKIPSWRSVIRNWYKQDKWWRDLHNMRTRVTTDDMRNINNTEPAKVAISLLHSRTGTTHVSLSLRQALHLCGARDHQWVRLATICFSCRRVRPFKEGTLGRHVSAFWAKTGVRPNISITSTKVRKMGRKTTLQEL